MTKLAAILDQIDSGSVLPRIVSYMERLARLRALLERDFHEEKITGEDKTVDVVVEIFNRVNSGGTKLPKGALRSEPGPVYVLLTLCN